MSLVYFDARKYGAVLEVMMNKVTKYLWLMCILILLLLCGFAAFNYSVDPMCYYHCPTVDLTKRTQNVYYQSAQTAVANPDAEILILGSSRGETTPPKWVEEVTGQKTINLSSGGADLLLKVAVLNAALDTGAKIKKVIWIADYFELVSASTDIKTKLTPALQRHISSVIAEGNLQHLLRHMQRLIDHNSFEASLEQLKNHPSSMFSKVGSGEGIDVAKCQDPDFLGDTPRDQLGKNVMASYGTSWVRLAADQDPAYINLFELQIRSLRQRGIEVILLIPPYHPDFTAKFAQEHRHYHQLSEQWVKRLESLSSEKIHVLNYSQGIPGDDKGPSFWNDGLHMTCKSVIIMLEQALSGDFN